MPTGALDQVAFQYAVYTAVDLALEHPAEAAQVLLEWAPDDSAEFHEEVARSLVGYVGDRLNRSPSGLTYELADELLAARGIDENLRRRFRSCLETCDFARFVPASAKTERRTEVLAEASELIEALERSW